MNYSFLRTIKFAFQDFYRNFWLSFATIIVLILAILSVNILVSLNGISNAVIDSVEQKIDVSVFFKEDVNQAQIDNFRQKITNLEEVDSVVFITKGEALDSFKEKHKDDPKILEALKEVEKNPLLDSLIIRAKDLDDYNKILGILQLSENQQIIKYQNYTDHEKIIERIQVISNKVNSISIVLTSIFSFIAILIVFNAIRVTIYTHREEIAVMKLVGASNRFIRLPFIFEGLIYSIVSMALAVGILYICFSALAPYLNDFLSVYGFNLIDYYNSNFITIFAIQFGAVCLLNVMSAGIAIGKYLRV